MLQSGGDQGEGIIIISPARKLKLRGQSVRPCLASQAGLHSLGLCHGPSVFVKLIATHRSSLRLSCKEYTPVRTALVGQ
jgi:hypothetical protein